MVEALPNTAPVDLDTVLFLEKGQRPLGKVFDVMGPIQAPIYCIRFNSHEEILSKQITTVMDVFCAPGASCTNFVILANLIKQKGSDASWRDDIEPPERFLDYSDDEQERHARRSGRPKKDQPERTPQPQRPNFQQRNQHPPRGYSRQNPNFRPMTPPHYPPRYMAAPMPPHMYPNPYGPPGQFFVNPFAYAPTVQYPPFNPTMFGSPPPPPPPNQWCSYFFSEINLLFLHV